MEGARPATVADVARVAQLARAAAAELVPMRGGRIWSLREARPEPIEGGIEQVLADPEAHVIVGTVDGVVIGYAVVRAERLQDGSELGVIDEIFVEEGARGVGVGEAMMEQLVAWCVERGCVGMDAIALPGHRLTKNFFESSGFTARKIVMHHSLLPDQTVAGDGT